MPHSGAQCFPATPSLRLLRFAQIRFAPCFDRSRNRILLAHRHFFSALDQFIGAFAKFTRFALRIFFALVRFLSEKISCLFAGLRRKKDADQGANAKTHKKISHLGTYVVRHDNLQGHRSTAKMRLQCHLTGICVRNGYCSFECSRPARIFSAFFREMTALSFSRPALWMFAMLPNSLSNFCAVFGPTPGILFNALCVCRLSRRWR